MFCPCGSSLVFEQCCQPIINQDKVASTAEQLMRSRFSAYAIGDAQYIFDTYSKTKQAKQTVKEIKAWADECRWVALVIHESLANIVEFSAYYIASDCLFEIRECSNFIKEQEQWRYVDGEITVNEQLSSIQRNEICPCNNYPSAWSAKKQKKYKHCCAKK